MVSRSYGPGRYDAQYEQQGHDYPAGYVRWTENRNIEAFLDLAAAGRVHPEVLTTHSFPIAEAETAFEMILTGAEPYLGVLLTYPERDGRPAVSPQRIDLRLPAPRRAGATVGISLLGAGSFARSVLLPNLRRLSGVELRGIASASGISARSAAKKFGFAFCASAEEEVFGDEQTDAVVIATPHAQHAAAICRCWLGERPSSSRNPWRSTRNNCDRYTRRWPGTVPIFAGTATKSWSAKMGLSPLRAALAGAGPAAQGGQSHFCGDNGNSDGKVAGAAKIGTVPRLMVGFNRRFSPLAAELKDFFTGCGPRMMFYRCNAGPLPTEHWLADPAQGGRLIGEACHFFDFFAYLTDARPLTVSAARLGTRPDDAAITVAYSDGSVGQLLYTSQGPSSFSKERIEVFSGGCAGVIDDFRVLRLQSAGRSRHRKLRFRADKGHADELAAFVRALQRGAEMPISPLSLMETTLVSLAAVESIRQARPVALAELMLV